MGSPSIHFYDILFEPSGRWHWNRNTFEGIMEGGVPLLPPLHGDKSPEGTERRGSEAKEEPSPQRRKNAFTVYRAPGEKSALPGGKENSDANEVPSFKGDKEGSSMYCIEEPSLSEEAPSFAPSSKEGISLPPHSAFEAIASNLTVTRFLDRTVTVDKTYWYTVTAKSETGIETERTALVSATPRETPKLIGATYQPPNRVVVSFDRQMGLTIGDESRYLLHEPKRVGGENEVSFDKELSSSAETKEVLYQTSVETKNLRFQGVSPVSVIRDRMGTRALLAFEASTLQLLTNDGTNEYELTVSNVADIDKNPIRAASQSFTIPRVALNFHHHAEHGGKTTAVKDFNAVRVYPNPVRPNVADRGAITFDRVPAGTRIRLFTPLGELLTFFHVSSSDMNRKQWWLTNNGIGDVSTGIYIYIMENDNLKKVGKIAVIK